MLLAEAAEALLLVLAEPWEAQKAPRSREMVRSAGPGAGEKWRTQRGKGMIDGPELQAQRVVVPVVFADAGLAAGNAGSADTAGSAVADTAAEAVVGDEHASVVGVGRGVAVGDGRGSAATLVAASAWVAFAVVDSRTFAAAAAAAEDIEHCALACIAAEQMADELAEALQVVVTEQKELAAGAAAVGAMAGPELAVGTCCKRSPPFPSRAAGDGRSCQRRSSTLCAAIHHTARSRQSRRYRRD